MVTLLKRVLVGRPLATSEHEQQRIPKFIALPVVERLWKAFGIDVPLEIVHAPYRDLVEPVLRHDQLENRWDGDTITVLIPEFVFGKWYQQALHNRTALALKMALLFRPGTVVTSVPYHVDPKPGRGATSSAGPGSRHRGRAASSGG